MPLPPARSRTSSVRHELSRSWCATDSRRRIVEVLLVAALAACQQQPAAKAPAEPAAPPPAAAPNATAAPAPADPQEPAWLGVRFEPGTTKVVQIIPNSPASASGIHLDDEIQSIDGVAMQTSQQIVKTISETAPGTNVTITLQRRGAQQTMTIKLATRPNDDKVLRSSLLDRPAPPFTTMGLDGKAGVALADLRGRVVLIDFWATWCGPCTSQFPHLNAWHQRYAAKGLHILGLSDEEPDLVREYVAAEKLAYPIALDPDDKIRAAYFVPGMPTTVVIDKTGIVRYVSVGTVNPTEIEAAFTKLL